MKKSSSVDAKHLAHNDASASSNPSLSNLKNEVAPTPRDDQNQNLNQNINHHITPKIESQDMTTGSNSSQQSSGIAFEIMKKVKQNLINQRIAAKADAEARAQNKIKAPKTSMMVDIFHNVKQNLIEKNHNKTYLNKDGINLLVNALNVVGTYVWRNNKKYKLASKAVRLIALAPARHIIVAAAVGTVAYKVAKKVRSQRINKINKINKLQTEINHATTQTPLDQTNEKETPTIEGK